MLRNIRCVVSVNGRKVGVLTARSTGLVRKPLGKPIERGYVYHFEIRKLGPPVVRKLKNALVKEISVYPNGQVGGVLHSPEDGIWTLILHVIQEARPDRWFPCPDRSEKDTNRALDRIIKE